MREYVPGTRQIAAFIISGGLSRQPREIQMARFSRSTSKTTKGTRRAAANRMNAGQLSGFRHSQTREPLTSATFPFIFRLNRRQSINYGRLRLVMRAVSLLPFVPFSTLPVFEVHKLLGFRDNQFLRGQPQSRVAPSTWQLFIRYVLRFHPSILGINFLPSLLSILTEVEDGLVTCLDAWRLIDAFVELCLVSLILFINVSWDLMVSSFGCFRDM